MQSILAWCVGIALAFVAAALIWIWIPETRGRQLA
jgi:hypothetical protein